MKNFILSFVVLLLAFASAPAQIITTVAGNGTGLYNGDNIPALHAGITPTGVAVDDSGNIYIGDDENNRIRKVDNEGLITTIAGTGVAGFSGDDSLAVNATLNAPSGIVLDGHGNLYFCDASNNRVRKIDAAGIITTVAGNGTGGFNGDNIPATAAALWQPFAITLGTDGSIYVVDCANHRIRKISTVGIITTVAGIGTPGFSGDDGPATSAELKYPRSVALDAENNMYIADAVNHRVRKIDASGIITTFAGNGIPGYSGDNSAATSAKMQAPYALAIDRMGNVYIADGNAISTIRMVNASGIITTYAGVGSFGYSGDNGPATAAALDEPSGLALDGLGNMYVADFQNGRIRLINSSTQVNTIEDNSEVLTVYPNPVNTDHFMLNIPPSNFPQNARIVITNISGEIIKKMSVITNGTIDVALATSPGVYVVTVNIAGKLLSSKVCLTK